MMLRLCIRLLAIMWIALCSLAAQASPARLPVPTVEYSADRTVVSDAGTFTGKVYFARDKERTELNAGGMESITILRRDLQLGYSLMPAQNMYRQLDFASARRQSGGATADDVEMSVVGNESIDGHATTKYKLLMKDGSAGGFMWFTEEGIAIKMDLLQKEHGKKTRMTMTLANLQVGAVDPQLFEVPAGYTQMPGGNPFSGFNGSSSGASASGAATSASTTGSATSGETTTGESTTGETATAGESASTTPAPGVATPSSGNIVSNALSKISLFHRH